MTTQFRVVMMAIALLGFANAGTALAFERVAVTVRQLFDQRHRLEITAGTEVAWSDPHFDRVWLKPGADNPKVERMAGEFRATFAKPGTYHGAFTVVGGHATADVYDMIVVVKPSAR